MSKKKYDFAFPNNTYSSGMRMRDFFAAHALAAIIQADGAQFFEDQERQVGCAYNYADAMMSERGDDP